MSLLFLIMSLSLLVVFAMSFDFDNTNINSEDDLSGDFMPVGTMHLLCTDVDDSFEEHEAVVVELEALAGTVENCQGKRTHERFYTTNKAIKRLQRLLTCTGAIKPGERKTITDFRSALVGKDFIGSFEEETYENEEGETKTITKLGFLDFWSTSNPRVKEIPKGKVRVIQIMNGEEEADQDIDADDDEFADL